MTTSNEFSKRNTLKKYIKNTNPSNQMLKNG